MPTIPATPSLDKHAALMLGLAERHRLIAELIGRRPFHYVDIPVHGNIGDLLILHGTLAFFTRYRLAPRISAPAFAYEPGWIRPDEAVVFHGGGNFGDLYSAYGMQPLREKVVQRFPRNRIIVLPQTLHFTSPAARRRSAALFRGHPDVHICVRDRTSYAIAQEFSEHVYLLPDMAHQLYPIVAPARTPQAGTLQVIRSDGEQSGAGVLAGAGAALVTDWPLLVGERERAIERFRRAMRATHRLGIGPAAGRPLAGLWASYSERLVARAAGLFAAHQRIVTDRLHGHILACLMNKPSTVLDNSYGKNFSYVDAWTGAGELVSTAGRQP